jgi:hypothetical protein
MRNGSAESEAEDKKSCEIWTGRKWEIWAVSAAYPHRHQTQIRCYECHGPIVLMNASENGRNRAHFEHRPSHPGCSLVYKYFSGTRSLHPLAVPSPQNSVQLALTDYISDEGAAEIIGEVTSTEKERLLLARVGQGLFRKKLVSRWKSCSVLGCGPETALVASHIVAWRSCLTNQERLDQNNGLLLSPNLDKLFDRQLISFSDAGILLISPELNKNDAKAFGVRQGMRLREVPKGIVKYLLRHRGSKAWKEPQL